MEKGMNYFNLDLPLFKLDDQGKMLIPPDTNSIWFDVGTSFNSPNSVQFLNRNPKGFVVGFEPDPRAYFGLFSAKSFSESMWLLDNSHESAKIELEKRSKNPNIDTAFKLNSEEFLRDENERFVMIPSAVSSRQKNHISFNVDNRVGCSSVKNHSSKSETALGRLYAQIANVVDDDPAETFSDNQILVPNINLNQIIDLIPDKYYYIDHLKIDCEKLDVDVIRSARGSIKRFVVVSTEVRCDDEMRSLGFEFLKSQPGSFSYVNKDKKNILGSIDYKIRV